MRSVTFRFLGLGLVASVGLAACMNGENATSSRADPATSRSGQIVERDIEDASVFSRREPALWDGRPSLGGAWVAHPDAKTPERVIIRNMTSGQETIGALFRRERMNPGPAFQVSAEAANAIGILAGAPTEIEVVALRTEEVQIAAAATPAAEAGPAGQPEAEQTQQVQAASPETPDGEDGPMVAAASQETRQSRGGFFGRIFGRGTTEAPATDQIETQSLDDQIAAAPQPDTAAAQPAPQPAPQAASTLERPFIQLGIFSVEANARGAEATARDAGLPARTVEGQTQGNAFWRVVIGPAQTPTEQSQMLARVKSLGFTDAYTVRR
ncbi:SPOR domain-containing protein [Roseinatronobacter bogoriensis]|uniref:SPOR domain-containing protein n=1 Tax=Roseinatronobacter bogoriensis subsp. barguzinensis TaxID=441209 RepID=A0A2K8KAX1_9RHOB|nr:MULTISPECIES: SPOR domain-containing protein [Rhodobaca]ATX66599.1 SPOR domain-containing protein [Rhodobaca barguzinensis]MBB4207774.1 cell division protein FtsN [Rhodobaca bogoriensis DSM 18756]TDW39919.1 cell division septation protein DedD [Rhodobaca barguzinensis]TDY70928.1 cell division septation protein DedD [Rhodobaca bogoriensis DSM 18756]